MYMETKYPDKVYKHHHFEAISELLSYINTTPISPLFTGHKLSSQGTWNSGWYGTSSFDEAITLLHKGWCPEAEQLSEKVPIKTTQSSLQSQRPTHSVVGYQASVPRYLQGIPTNMITSKPVTKKQKIITLYKSLSYSSVVSTSEIECEGIKALKIIQALEGKGYRVKLNMIWLSKVLNEISILSLTVKKPQDRLSLIKMAFPLVHPSMLRRICFACMERNPYLRENFTQGYGRPCSEDFIPQKGEIFLPPFIQDVGKFVNSLNLI